MRAKNLISSLTDRILNFFRKSGCVITDKKTWESIEHYDPIWKERIKQIALHLENGTTVADFGCGRMWLKEYLPNGCKYIPVDRKRWDDHTVVCDFNKGQYPEINMDTCVLSGCLEYILDVNALIRFLAKHARKIVVSYCCLDENPDKRSRRELAWVNDFNFQEIVDIFALYGFALEKNEKYKTTTTIFVFRNNN